MFDQVPIGADLRLVVDLVGAIDEVGAVADDAGAEQEPGRAPAHHDGAVDDLSGPAEHGGDARGEDHGHEGEPGEATHILAADQGRDDRAHQGHGEARIAQGAVEQGQEKSGNHQGGDLHRNGRVELTTVVQRQAHHAAHQHHADEGHGQRLPGHESMDGRRRGQRRRTDQHAGIVGDRLASQDLGPIADAGNGRVDPRAHTEQV